MSCVLHGAQAGLCRRSPVGPPLAGATRLPLLGTAHALAVLVHQAHVVVRLDVAAPPAAQ